ncbi:hypothetical protein [Hymenobacter persicinus]|uniref:STAS/SEC14 domain-containing protein n=1 Tax=Hymenobacter persicinus TaxID=2025506 RepID=A0A4Q5LEA8_9BACT|nr:hypothetical protein [Hymenobacter persicinus]RYU82194.1 hypothetical protein EWM57_05280 [Hymenobacter persicinus]
MSAANCLITFRPDLATLVARWQDDAPVGALQADFAALLAEAQSLPTALWLLDVRRRENLDPELASWTTTTFFPQAAAALRPARLRIAVLCSPARLAVYASDDYQMQQLTYGMAPERPYQMQLFGDEGAAMLWLLAE